jgi:hypothetical protein
MGYSGHILRIFIMAEKSSADLAAILERKEKELAILSGGLYAHTYLFPTLRILFLK